MGSERGEELFAPYYRTHVLECGDEPRTISTPTQTIIVRGECSEFFPRASPPCLGGMYVVRGLHHESATHSKYTYEPTIKISATLATSARDGIRLDNFCRIGVNLAETSQSLGRDCPGSYNQVISNTGFESPCSTNGESCRFSPLETPSALCPPLEARFTFNQ